MERSGRSHSVDKSYLTLYALRASAASCAPKLILVVGGPARLLIRSSRRAQELARLPLVRGEASV